jgi:hypothetical protein
MWPRRLVVQLLENVIILRDSSWVQGDMADGRIADRRDVLLQQGRKKFGPPDEAVEAALRTITDYDRLTRMTDRILDVTTWAELLATP